MEGEIKKLPEVTILFTNIILYAETYAAIFKKKMFAEVCRWYFGKKRRQVDNGERIYTYATVPTVRETNRNIIVRYNSIEYGYYYGTIRYVNTHIHIRTSYGW